MVKKGYHYIVDCDSKGCDISYVVGVARHNFDARRQAKQKLIKQGWTPGQVGTFECPECKLKREKKNEEIIKRNMEKRQGIEAETAEAVKNPAEHLEGVTL